MTHLKMRLYITAERINVAEFNKRFNSNFITRNIYWRYYETIHTYTESM